MSLSSSKPSDPQAPDPPISKDEAKTQGLKVFPSMYGCRRPGHGNLRRTHDNQCVRCLAVLAEEKDKLKAKAREEIKAEVKREILAEMRAAQKAAQMAEMERLKYAAKADRDAARKQRKADRAKAKAAETRAAKKAARLAAEGLDIAPWDEPAGPPQVATVEPPDDSPVDDWEDDPNGFDSSEPPW
jgi:hypothetical protein